METRLLNTTSSAPRRIRCQRPVICLAEVARQVDADQNVSYARRPDPGGKASDSTGADFRSGLSNPATRRSDRLSERRPSKLRCFGNALQGATLATRTSVHRKHSGTIRNLAQPPVAFAKLRQRFQLCWSS